ncbi:MAG: hypothetical protein AAGM22_16375 [Acidobacteriota bacterium]
MEEESLETRLAVGSLLALLALWLLLPWLVPPSETAGLAPRAQITSAR